MMKLDPRILTIHTMRSITTAHIAKMCLRFLRNFIEWYIVYRDSIILLSIMQKSPLSLLLREEAIRALTFGGIFCVLVIATIAGVANAANGGLFGDILNKILASWDYTNAWDGTVKNTAKLWNNPPTAYQKIAIPNQSCALNQCIYGFDGGWNILCR